MNSLLIHDVLVDSSRIVSGDLALSHSMMGETLAADDLTITIDTGMAASGGFYEGYIPVGDTEPYETADDGIYFIKCAPVEVYMPKGDTEAWLTSDGEEYLLKILPLDVSAFAPGDEMLYYSGDVLVGKYFLQKMTRIGRTRYKLEATSAVGLLIQSDHYGGVYSDVKAQVIFADILGDIPYTLSTALKNAVIYGYLPIASRRDNLQQLLFATGGALFTDNTGKLNITTMQDAIVGTFDASRCYIGGSVEVSDAVPAVDVTEHNYFSTAEIEPVTLLEEGVDGSVTVRFNGPHYNLQCTGGTITESSANHAVIQAQGFVTLTGKPYTHITHVVRAGDAAAVNNVKSVTNATLANPQIAQALAKRLYQFLQCTTRIRQDVLFGTERAGQMVRVVNPYTMETETAAVTEFDVSMSGVNKASGSFLVGFEPQGVLSGYQHYIVLTGSDSWTAPEEVAATGTIRVIACGAGSGGDGGEAGENGQKLKDGTENFRSVAATNTVTDEDDNPIGGSTGGKGGKAGTGGAGGKIFEFTLAVTPGQVFSYSCGIGGTGGTGGEPEYSETVTTTEDVTDQETLEVHTVTTTTENVTPEVEPGEGTTGTASVFGGRSSDWGKEYPAGYYEPKTGLTIGVTGSDGYDGGAGGMGAPYPTNKDGADAKSGDPGESCGSYTGGNGGTTRWAYTAAIDGIHGRAGGGGGGGAAYGAYGGSGTGGYTGIDIDTYRKVGDPKSGDGGNGATPASGMSSTIYGCGGSGGNGGGGGGGVGAAFYRDFAEDTEGIAYAGAPGAGGDGSAGGNGADGVIIIYY